MNTTLNQLQRKEFDRALQGIRGKAVRSLSDKRDEANKIALQELLETFDGAVELAATAKRLRSELDDAEKKLESFGFELGRGGEVELAYHPPESVKEVFEARVERHLAAESEKVEAIDAAISNAWTVSTLPEAMKIVKQFA